MAIACPECGFELREAFFESPDYRACQICGSEVSVLPFPACFIAPKSITAFDLIRADDEASCFHHDSKKAVHSCTRCGKFLCALCAAEVGADILCPECLVAGERPQSGGRPDGRSDTRLERERVLYDSIALTAAIAPAFTISLTIFGAPAAIYLALRYWRRPTSIVRRFRWRRYAALLIALAEMAFWIFILVTAIARRPAK